MVKAKVLSTLLKSKLSITGAIFLFAAIGLFSLSFLVGKLLDSPPSSAEIAAVEVFSGAVKIIRSGGGSSFKTQNRTEVQNLDSLETEAQATALLNLPGAGAVKIFPNSRVTVNLKNPQKPKLVVQSGYLETASLGKNPILVAYQGEELSLQEYMKKAWNPVAGKQFKKSTGNPFVGEDSDQYPRNTLSPELIEARLLKQKNNLLKCYAQLLQRTPSARGEAQVALTIEPTGRISELQFLQNQFGDLLLEKCLSSVIHRVEFPNFSGDPVTTTIPLRFE